MGEKKVLITTKTFQKFFVASDFWIKKLTFRSANFRNVTVCVGPTKHIQENQVMV